MYNNRDDYFFEIEIKLDLLMYNIKLIEVKSAVKDK